MSDIEQKTNGNDRAKQLMELNDHIEYLEGKMEYYRVQLADAYYKLATMKSKGKTTWGDGNGY